MNRPPLSLRWRLMALILVPLTLISIATGYWRFSGAEQTANEVFDQTLVALLLAVSKDVSTSGGDVLSEATSQLLGNIYSDRLYYHVHGPDGAFTTGYATPPVKPPELTVTEDIPVLYDSRYRGRPVRVAKLMERTSLDTLSGLSAVTVWQPVSGRQAIAGRIAGRALIVIISLYLTVAGVIFFGIKLGLRPLTSLQSAIALRSGDDLSQIRRPVPVEVNGLVETLNGLFHQVTAVLESRDRFISDAAHQLRNPIAGLLSVAEAAGAATNAKDRAQRVWDVINAARHVSRVTHQLLSLERIKASSGATHFRPVDLRNIVRTVCERNARTILAGETDFAFDMADVPVMVSVDAFLISEAIQNLIDNALVHGGPDNPEITVTVRSDGDTGVVCVSDRGTGLSHRDSATVFTRFRQLQPGHGSGLGLAIVDEIASLHGGTVAIMDVPVGARVEIALPMARNGTAI